jgi:sirohydrochlorin ferrochelatase
VVAHGSRRTASNDEVRKLCERLQQEQDGEEYEVISAGFLELAEPSIPDGIAKCIQRGADHVVVVPYFLSAGRHVTEDIPAEVEKAIAAHPQTTILLAPYLGSAPGVSKLLFELVEGGEKDGDPVERSA